MVCIGVAGYQPSAAITPSKLRSLFGLAAPSWVDPGERSRPDFRMHGRPQRGPKNLSDDVRRSAPAATNITSDGTMSQSEATRGASSLWVLDSSKQRIWHQTLPHPAVGAHRTLTDAAHFGCGVFDLGEEDPMGSEHWPYQRRRHRRCR